MNFIQSFRLALKALSTSKMRSLLTMLGIIIGVAAVIIIISLGDGMSDKINSEFEQMGTNLLQVQIIGRGSDQGVTVDDMYAFRAENTNAIASMSPGVSVVGATLKVGGETFTSTLLGAGEEYMAVKNLELAQGRFLQYIDVARLQKVCVIGSYVDQESFNGNALGKTVRINGDGYTVVGVLAEQADNTSYGNDNYIYIPYTCATRVNGSAFISQYFFTAVNEESNSRAKALIESKLKRVYGSDDYYMVISMSEMLSMLGDIQGTVMTVLVAIAAISLLVGGIGIMNIMLVSVTERTREIGIRKSLGAKGRDIRSQFIIEAGATSALGGILGIALGAVLSGAIGGMMGITARASFPAIAVSAGVSLAVGILFGYLPANKAARLNPIDALRYE